MLNFCCTTEQLFHAVWGSLQLVKSLARPHRHQMWLNVNVMCLKCLRKMLRWVTWFRSKIWAVQICECASIQPKELKVTGWTYLYNHINYLHLCWRPRALSDLQQAHVRQPWLAVVAIETRAYVCGCVFACVQDPDMPYRLGPALSQGSRPDMTPVRVSFHLGRRDDRDGPGLDSAFSWNGKEGNCSIGVAQENVQARLLWDSQLWKWAFLRWMYFFFWRHKGLQAFKQSILVPLVWWLRGELPDRGQTW